MPILHFSPAAAVAAAVAMVAAAASPTILGLDVRVLVVENEVKLWMAAVTGAGYRMKGV